MRACCRGAIVGVLVWLCLSAAARGVEPAATPRFATEGRFTLECHGTTTANGAARADTQIYTVDTKRCAIAPWPAAECRCIDETITCDNRDAAKPDGLVVNRLTAKVVQQRPNWQFVGRCRRR